HHLPDRGGLSLLHRRVLDAVQLGDPVDQGGDLGPELDDDLLEGDVGVLNRVVEQGGGDGGGVEPVVSQVPGYGQGVGYVGVAGLSELAGMGAVGQFVGAPEEVDVALGVVGAVGLHHVVERGR